MKSSIDCFLGCNFFISLYVILGQCIASGNFKCESLFSKNINLISINFSGKKGNIEASPAMNEM